MDLSIIIPMYNKEKNIVSTLKSIYEQDCLSMDFEVIIIDDGSTDNSNEYAENYLTGLPNTNWQIIYQENLGVSAARNKGLLFASGEYLFFLDSDDLLKNNFFCEIYTLMSSQFDNELIIFKYDVVSEDGYILSRYEDICLVNNSKVFSSRELLNDILNHKMSVWTSSIIYERNFILSKNLTFDTQFVNGEDQHFIWRAVSKSKKIFYMDECLVYYVQHPQSISNTFKIQKFDSVMAFYDLKKIIGNKSNGKLFDLYIMENFFFNFKQALRLEKEKSGPEIWSDIVYLYPLMEIILSTTSESYSKKSLKNRIEFFLFANHLSLYSFLYRIYAELTKRKEIKKQARI